MESPSSAAPADEDMAAEEEEGHEADELSDNDRAFSEGDSPHEEDDENGENRPTVRKKKARGPSYKVCFIFLGTIQWPFMCTKYTVGIKYGY